jgi:deoxyribodipyrimidine photo-lyase
MASAFPASENEASRRLDAFTQGDNAPVYDYANTRNRPDLEGTAQLSPYLRFGLLSARMAAGAAWRALNRAPTAAAARSAETWLNELIWREFYVQILDAFPYVRSGAFRPAYNEIEWLDDDEGFTAWCDGLTGYPIVDAAMNQLRATGWMHNRLRMVVASFLVKDLLIDWRRGERWFMQTLLDGDPAANNGGWQWTAGTGTDAAPYFRIFNPVSQGTKFDPNGDYVRRWLPALAHVPASSIHAPWTLSRADQQRARCRIGLDYPEPIIDHAFARERVLAAFAAVRGAA